ncbi:Lrp/AsnC family transcriptional regulator [archaeon]|jgi:DNA-binding Lrp family transcriptional regulator|nr:Lrp/AsnC family transcriptional regulator [archaeon]MBT4397776.1 Lrp/AsnC family transcriptional regulator [archaeon]MBT4441110.1 Lrp/AsnC family transcriptional regulator [archaeon]
MEKDRIILSLLREDARISLTKMSRKTKIPVSTLYERIRKSKYIKKHTSLLDFERLGYGARAKVLFKVDRKDREALREFLCKCQFINELIRVNNGYDFLVEFVFEQMRGLENYLEILEKRFNIKDNKVFYIVDELKRENFLSNHNVEKMGKPFK